MNKLLLELIDAYSNKILDLMLEISELKKIHKTTIEFYENEIDTLQARNFDDKERVELYKLNYRMKEFVKTLDPFVYDSNNEVVMCQFCHSYSHTKTCEYVKLTEGELE